MVLTRRRSSRLQGTPQRGRDAQTQGNIASPAVATTPNMPTLGEVDEQTESPAPKGTVTPQTSDRTSSCIPTIVTHTPTNQTPIKPSGVEMHPAHYQHSTAKPLEEARWLGFLNMAAHTEPIKKGTSKIPITQATPTKSQELTTTFGTPEFKFRFRRPSLELSPEAKKMMEESRQEAQKIRAQMAANPDQFGIEKTEDIARRIAKPKGKTSRFSAVHMAEFKKMDSIANHPSVLRADPNRVKPGTASLKRSPSKAELDKLEKPDGRLSRTKSTASLRKAEQDATSGPAKRVKHNKEDDASSTRPAQSDGEGKQDAQKNATATRSNTNIPRPRSLLATPTKASLARSQSVKTLKKTTLIPSLARSPSVSALKTPSKTPSTFKEGLRKASQTVSRLPSMKSILRSPVRHYSNDPAKIAAGTHIVSPPDLDKDLPAVPATAPVNKRVNFTDSTLGKVQNGNGGDMTSAARASSEAPQEKLSDVAYPELPTDSPARRTTMGAGDFTFRSDRTIKFGAGIVKGPTIRHVRSSDAASTLVDPFNNTSAKKRKVDVPSEITESEKENDEEGGRPAKRVKASATPAKEPEAASRTPKRKETRRGALSQARLNLLAQPKRRV